MKRPDSLNHIQIGIDKYFGIMKMANDNFLFRYERILAQFC